MKASQIQSAVNIATDFLAQQPKEKIELFFRRGTYLIDSKVISDSFEVVMVLMSFQENPVFNMKNIKPINHGRLIISGAGSFRTLASPIINTFLEGMEETTLKIIGWQGDMFKGTNVSKVNSLSLVLLVGFL